MIMERSDHRRSREAGLTIMELALVIGLVGIMMAGASMGVSAITRADLRSGASRTAASMRYAFDRATMTGTYIRLAFDMDKGRIWAETSADMITLRSGRSQHVKDDDDEEEKGEGEGEESAEAPAKTAKKSKSSSALAMFGLGGSSDEDEDDSGDEEASTGIDLFSLTKGWEDDMKPVERPKASFTELSDIVAKKFKLARGIKIAAVITPRMKEPAEGGIAYVYFFPQGHAEPAIIQLVDKDQGYYSVVLHPLTGRAKVYACRYKVPEEFGVSDDKRETSKDPCGGKGD